MYRKIRLYGYAWWSALWCLVQASQYAAMCHRTTEVHVLKTMMIQVIIEGKNESSVLVKTGKRQQIKENELPCVLLNPALSESKWEPQSAQSKKASIEPAGGRWNPASQAQKKVKAHSRDCTCGSQAHDIDLPPEGWTNLLWAWGFYKCAGSQRWKAETKTQPQAC